MTDTPITPAMIADPGTVSYREGVAAGAKAERERTVAMLREPSGDVIDAIEPFLGYETDWFFTRRNKARIGDQWEVCEDVDQDAPISDEIIKVVGVYPTQTEADRVAFCRATVFYARGVLSVIADHLLKKGGE